MAKKKSKAVEVSEDPKMTGEELYKARAFMAESDLAKTQAQLAMMKKRDLLKQIDPEGKLAALDREVVVNNELAAVRKTQFKAALQEVGDRLKVDPALMSWDDETGAVVRLDPDE